MYISLGLHRLLKNVIDLLLRAWPRLLQELNVCVSLRKSVTVLIQFSSSFFVVVVVACFTCTPDSIELVNWST